MEETKKADGFDLKSGIKTSINIIGLPTLIIAVFWIIIMILGVIKELSLATMLTDSLNRFGRWGLLTLAMVPAIQSGVGPNFALPLGVLCGLLAELLAFVLGLTGMSWILCSVFLAIIFATLMGLGYGKLMNAVKGSEMSIATYTGFSATYFFCLLWVVLPFRDQRLTWPLGGGIGIRQTIQLGQIGVHHIFDDFLNFTVFGVTVPTGLLLVFFGACFLIWLFMRSKIGLAITAGGSNAMFANAAGLNVDRNRIIANVVSTVLGALGIIVYGQSYGYAQFYADPLYMAFPAVAAILIGGATVSRAKISHVIVGTLIFQGLLATALPVTNAYTEGLDLSETLRQIVQNGVILYALTQVGRRKNK